MTSEKDSASQKLAADNAVKTDDAAPDADPSLPDAASADSDEVEAEAEPDSVTVGSRLRAARQDRRLELSHIAAETRIPIRHLESIEAGDFDDLPSRTYAIGFSRNYARSVGLDQDAVADQVREELSDDQARASAMAGGMEPGDPAKLPSAGLAWFGGIAALILAVGSVAFLSSYFGAGSGPAPLTAQNEASSAGGAVAQAGDEADAGGAQTGRTAAANASQSGGQVVFTALEDGVWVRFYEDGGERLYEAQMESGDRFELPADAIEPRINTGRPDAFAITIGGREVPKLADEPVTMGNTPVSASALLARNDISAGQVANN